VPHELSTGDVIGDRVAILEHLLKEYYLDAHYLEKLRKKNFFFISHRARSSLFIKFRSF